jgi:hypothetical protein
MGRGESQSKGHLGDPGHSGLCSNLFSTLCGKTLGISCWTYPVTTPEEDCAFCHWVFPETHSEEKQRNEVFSPGKHSVWS